MRVAVNSLSLFVYLVNRVQEEEFIKLVTKLDAKQLEISSVDSRNANRTYPKMMTVKLLDLICAEAIEFLQKVENLPS